ncbi:MAG: methyltransferase domain-containing protein [Candidatus Binatia bacterium]
MSSSFWRPDQYNRFRAERQQPFFDLLALVRPRAGMRIADLGCGTGELTRVLHERLAARETLGIDESDTMLAASRAFAAPGLRFALMDIRDFAGAEYDLVFSNAALHWVPDHAELFARLTRALGPGGQLAIQIPVNFDHPSHAVAAAVAREEPFRTALNDYAIDCPHMPPEWYAALLDRLGFAEQHVRMQVYPHQLPAPDDVIEWVKGTLLTAYEQRLPPELWPAFMERYRAQLLPSLGNARPYFFAFKRLLMWAVLA